MKLLINSTTLISTGVVQVAVSFLNECIQFDENEYMVLMSPMVSTQIDQALFPSNFSFRTVRINPNKLLKGYYSRNYIKSIENEWKPDCVFSVFGPSYWTPNVPHLSGYAYPHYVYPESPYFSKISLLKKLSILLYKTIHKYYFKKNGNYFVCETDDVSLRTVKFLGFDPQKVHTVSNTYSKYFDEFIFKDDNHLLPPKLHDEFRFLSLCSLYPHKNLEILNEVIPLLNDLNIKVKFILTIDENLYQKSFNEIAKQSIINIGRVDIDQCPQLYSEVDALFLPTLLECFTANYPEAMKMGKPIITSNLSFATSICKNAALYFDPLNASDIKEKIYLLTSSFKLRNQLIKEGERLASEIPTAKIRASQYLNICKDIYNRHTK